MQRKAEWREGRGMAYGKAKTKTNCLWFDLGLTLVSGWVSDQTTTAAETVQMEHKARIEHLKTVWFWNYW